MKHAPLPTKNPPVTAGRLARFEAKFTPEPNSGCFLWLGGVNEHGYGIFWNGERLEKAHRFALRAAGADVPDDADVCHTCDNPACVNAAHLFVGDAQANVDDMWAKRRATVQRRCGTAQNQAKLSDDAVERIRARYARGGITQYDLAYYYGVSQTTIWKVVNDRNWLLPSGVIVEQGRGR